MKRLLQLAIIGLALVPPAYAQFAGPSETGAESTVAQAQAARSGTYVTVTGNVVSHLREEYYLFRDSSGEIRVEIDDSVWRNRKVDPETRVRLNAEVDRNSAGTVYLWVKSLDIVQ